MSIAATEIVVFASRRAKMSGFEHARPLDRKFDTLSLRHHASRDDGTGNGMRLAVAGCCCCCCGKLEAASAQSAAANHRLASANSKHHAT